MRVIYSPTARAAEYATLACNIGVGCTGGCRYCYAKHTAHKSAAEFHKAPAPRKNLLAQLGRDLWEMDANQDRRDIFLSFLCDPFEPTLVETTFEAMRLIIASGRRVRTLTKRPTMAPWQLLAALDRSKIDFGVSLTSYNNTLRRHWEPGTNDVDDRTLCLREALHMGMKTWVSMEPVLDTWGCLALLSQPWLRDAVGEWRIGKLNGQDPEARELERSIDWCRFLRDVRKEATGLHYMVKEDLLKYETP